ncbi:hypothetical protein [Paracoccus endophyticus]|uniref:hypothetical protein n=1 Tax=Paracoccus endophyticus TaxID=2233774 RepID=UPI000DD660A8|nr:hypothetical protein [Paracoccus endophyticus]
MPLPHFLLMLAAVIVTAGATLLAALSLGVPFQVMGLVVLAGAVVVHLAARSGDAGDGPHHHPGG